MSDPRPIGEDDLQAALDGRLPPERRALVERYLATHPEAARHLRRSLRTGAFCRYAPDPRLPVRWLL